MQSGYRRYGRIDEGRELKEKGEVQNCTVFYVESLLSGNIICNAKYPTLDDDFNKLVSYSLHSGLSIHFVSPCLFSVGIFILSKYRVPSAAPVATHSGSSFQDA